MVQLSRVQLSMGEDVHCAARACRDLHRHLVYAGVGQPLASRAPCPAASHLGPWGPPGHPMAGAHLWADEARAPCGGCSGGACGGSEHAQPMAKLGAVFQRSKFRAFFGTFAGLGPSEPPKRRLLRLPAAFPRLGDRLGLLCASPRDPALLSCPLPERRCAPVLACPTCEPEGKGAPVGAARPARPGAGRSLLPREAVFGAGAPLCRRRGDLHRRPRDPPSPFAPRSDIRHRCRAVPLQRASAGVGLPAVTVALCAFVWALVANIYPAIVQSLVVNPAENVKEQPYIEDNIQATTWAYGLEDVISQPFQGNSTITAAEVTGKSPSSLANEQSLANITLLQPSLPGLTSLFTKEQGFRSYYSMSQPSADRYDLTGPDGKAREAEVLVSARELDPGGISPATWVNKHLQYTHGYGAVVVPTGQEGIGQDGYPRFSLSGLPPTGQPSLSKQPQIYFSTNPQVAKGYVVADSDQPELDYENSAGNQVAGHYDGSGGVKAGGFFRRVAFALAFGDYNILFSSQVDASSRILYYRNVEQRLHKVAPFLTYDSHPYPVIDNGRLYWVVDAYTTSDYFPYSEQADKQRLAPWSNLAGQRFNYIRDSVKAVVDAYSGKMWFFVEDPSDPVLQAWRSAFPSLFTSMSAANRDIPGITAHWRYPMDLFIVQANMFQRYHQQDPSVFYNNSQAWSIAQNPATSEEAEGTPGATGRRGRASSGRGASDVMPMYELVALPGSTQQSFVLVQPFVPSSGDGDRQNLTGFMTASSDPNDYGQLTLYTVPPGQSVDGPDLVTSAVQANSAISEEISLLNHAGSRVVLGDVVLTPIGQSLIYTQPLWVEQANSVPRLDDVIVVYNGNAFHSGPSSPSVYAALCNVVNPDGGHPFASYCPPTTRPTLPVVKPSSRAGTHRPTSPTTTTSPTTALPTSRPKGGLSKYLTEAQQDFALANAALREGDLVTYQAYLRAGEALVALAGKLATSPTTAGKPSTSVGARVPLGVNACASATSTTSGAKRSAQAKPTEVDSPTTSPTARARR